MSEILKLDDSNALTYPFTFKSTWKLTVAEKVEVFAAIQVEFTGTAPVIVCVIPANGATEINPIIVPYSGAIIPVVGKGYAASGSDKYGNAFTTDVAVTQILALGGK